MSGALTWLLGALALASAFAVFRCVSMARAAAALLVSLLATAGLLLTLGSPFLFAAAALLAVGQAAVLGLFLISFVLDPGGLRPAPTVHRPWVAAAAGTGAFAVLAATVLLTRFPVPLEWAPPDVTAALGNALMGPSLLVFLSVGALLFTTLIALVVLAARRGRFGAAVSIPRRPGESMPAISQRRQQGSG